MEEMYTLDMYTLARHLSVRCAHYIHTLHRDDIPTEGMYTLAMYTLATYVCSSW